MSDKVKMIKHNGKDIVFADYSNTKTADFVVLIEEQEKITLKSANKTVHHLMDFTNAAMKKEAKVRADAMLKMLISKGYTVHSACYGVTRLTRIIANAAQKNMYFAKDEADAKEWLSNC